MDCLLLDENNFYYSEGRWYEPFEYDLVADVRGYKICSYCPGIGENKGLFCGNKAIYTDLNPNDYRCEDCKDKKENATKDEISFRWLLPEDYFNCKVNLCSFIPKSGPHFGEICGLLATNRDVPESKLRCNLCRTDKSNLKLFRLYKKISTEPANSVRRVISHRIKKAKSSMF